MNASLGSTLFSTTTGPVTASSTDCSAAELDSPSITPAIFSTKEESASIFSDSAIITGSVDLCSTTAVSTNSSGPEASSTDSSDSGSCSTSADSVSCCTTSSSFSASVDSTTSAAFSKISVASSFISLSPFRAFSAYIPFNIADPSITLGKYELPSRFFTDNTVARGLAGLSTRLISTSSRSVILNISPLFIIASTIDCDKPANFSTGTERAETNSPFSTRIPTLNPL